MLLAMVRPKPDPLSALFVGLPNCSNLLNNLAISSLEMPGPVSSTAHSASSPRFFTSMVMLPRSVNFTALLSRFIIT